MKEAAQIFDRIHQVCSRIGRDPDSVQVLGATKKQPADRINEYIAWCNAKGKQALIGENYVQEWLDKHGKLRGDYRCHCIGHLQSNKARDAAGAFSAIQSVDSLKLARKLDAAAQGPLKVFIQVNISDDEAKSGIAPEEVLPLAREILTLQHLSLYGLMTIPKLYQDPPKVRLDYRALKQLADSVSGQISIPLALSMGMSDDFEIAIEEGASIVRIGTVLFGSRQ